MGCIRELRRIGTQTREERCPALQKCAPSLKLQCVDSGCFLNPVTAVPWNSDYYPPSMSHLPDSVREKAIEIANALLEEGMEEGKAIRIAIAKAKEWADRHLR